MLTEMAPDPAVLTLPDDPADFHDEELVSFVQCLAVIPKGKE
jgi:hypothetical protein